MAGRINRFFNPQTGDFSQGDRAMRSFAEGGFLGRGPGEGTIKTSLPDAHTDYIFAVVAEEYGVLACLALLLLFAFVVIRALLAAVREPEPATRLAIVGLGLMFGLQALINMGVNVGLLPAKGMTLPFISAGGSSMLAVSLTLGMMLALTRQRADHDRLKKAPIDGQPRRTLGTTVRCKSDGSRSIGSARRRGTGGHLFPAFALAEELGRRGLAVDLVTDMRGDRYGTGFPARKIYQVPSATPGSKRSPVALARTGVTLARGVMAARKLLRDVKPAAVIGFGGYPTIPPLMAARMLGIPSALHEQNAVLGRANRLLAKRADASRAFVRQDEACRRSDHVQIPPHGQPRARRCHCRVRSSLSGACSRRAPSGCWCSAAARVRATSPRPCRRRWPLFRRTFGAASTLRSRRARRTSTGSRRP